jgi:hypothetical protein
MEIDYAPSHNPTLFGSLSVSPPASMFDSFSPLLHLNDDFLDVLKPLNDDDDIEDWMKPILFDSFFDHDLQQNFFNLNDIEIKQEKKEDEKVRLILNSHSQLHKLTQENEYIDIFRQHTSEQQLPTTIRLIHHPKIEPAEIPTTLYLNGNELQFHPIVTTNNHTNGKTIGHTYTSK